MKLDKTKKVLVFKLGFEEVGTTDEPPYSRFEKIFPLSSQFGL